MATTIKSTALDFNNIKSNLKSYLQSKTEFTDYDFEASALSNLLDVLAYNTHINGLIANFALNESYLGTAQLRSSLVSLSEGIGYIPDTKTASQAVVKISFNTTASGRDGTIDLPAGTQFTASVDDIVYTFQTLEKYTATDDGTGFYEFKTSEGSNELKIYEGARKVKTFLVGEVSENPVYIIPDKDLDADTVTVKVFETATSTNSSTYTSLLSTTTINASSTIYILKESPNEFFELTFGDGVTFGVAPEAGNKIEVTYISTNGAPANTASVFTPVSTFTGGGVSGATLNISTVTASIGGDEKETIESIRKNAPFQYAAQNRMVTAADYSTLILRNYSTLIKDIKSWGGEDNLEPDFGAVYVSILFEDDVTAATQTATKDAIKDLAAQLAVVSFRLEYSDPTQNYVESKVFFQFNPNLTTLTVNAITQEVDQVINNYFSNNTGKFEQSFRRSNLLSLVDDVSPAVLSSRADIKVNQRITPVLGLERTFNLRYAMAIAQPDDVNFIVESSSFTLSGQTCRIRNTLKSTNLEVVNISTGAVVKTSIGEYFPSTGKLDILNFAPTAISGGATFIKISVTPANQSAISPTNQDVLVFDDDASFSRNVTVSAPN